MTMGHADSASQYINLQFMSRNILGLMARLFWSFSPFLSGVKKFPAAAGVCYKRHTPVGQSGLFCPFLFYRWKTLLSGLYGFNLKENR
jgi:hypothetical protein